MSKTAPKTKEAKGTHHKDDRPMDRPMTGIHTRDDGVRTEHGKHPLDPEYAGTTIAPNAGTEQAKAARVEAGLEEPEKAKAEPEAA